MKRVICLFYCDIIAVVQTQTHQFKSAEAECCYTANAVYFERHWKIYRWSPPYLTQALATLHCCHLHNACLECQFCRGRMRSLWSGNRMMQHLQVELTNSLKTLKNNVWLGPTLHMSSSYQLVQSVLDWRPSSNKSFSVTFRVRLTFELFRSRVTIPVEIPKELSSDAAAIKTRRKWS